MYKFIIAEIRKDTIEPYSRWNMVIPFVLASSNPDIMVGSRLDWGYIQLLLKNGYSVQILPECKE